MFWKCRGSFSTRDSGYDGPSEHEQGSGVSRARRLIKAGNVFVGGLKAFCLIPRFCLQERERGANGTSLRTCPSSTVKTIV